MDGAHHQTIVKKNRANSLLKESANLEQNVRTRMIRTLRVRRATATITLMRQQVLDHKVAIMHQRVLEATRTRTRTSDGKHNKEAIIK